MLQIGRFLRWHFYVSLGTEKGGKRVWRFILAVLNCVEVLVEEILDEDK